MHSQDGSASPPFCLVRTLSGRTDHHCPWVNNCVGHGNYPHFLRFLVAVDAAVLYHLAMLTRRVMAGIDTAYFVRAAAAQHCQPS
jgi:hypothetical protein